MRTKEELKLQSSEKPAVAESVSARVAQILENIAFYGLLGVVFFAAIPYGTVEPWFKLLFVFLICIFVVFRIFEGKLTNTPIFSNKLFFAPLLGILLLAIVQIIPFQRITNLFNFQSPISLDTYVTKNFILVFFGLILVGESLLRYTTSEKRLRQLIYLVLGISISSTLFGFIRILFLDGGNNFLSSFFYEKIQFAQFVNKNHYAYLVEMSLGLLLGLQLKTKLEQWQKPIYWLMTGLSCFSIIWINSRGAILSMVGLSIFAVLLYFFTKNDVYYELDTKPQKSRNRKYLKPILTAILFSSLLFGFAAFIISFVGSDSVVNRIETIQEEMAESKTGKISRREIWLATFELIKANPVVGVGFGAYPLAITAYDKSSGELALQQAHNDYLEVLANGGIIAFTLMLIFIILLIKKISVQINSGSSLRRASCFGATVGIFGIMLHSLVDFGLHIIINALILIILVVLATAKINPRSEKQLKN